MKFSTSLKKSDSFLTVYRGGKVRSDPFLLLYTLKNGTNTNRLGISISKKCGNSVVRHRFIRRVKEIYRLHEETFLQGYDLIVVARKTKGNDCVQKDGYRALEKSFLLLTKKAGIRQ